LISKLKYILLLFFIAISLNAQSVTVFANTDTTDYIVGDYIYYTLELNYPKNTRIEIPQIQDSITVLDFIKEEPVVSEESGNTVHILRKYIFSKYDSADVTIPSFRINYFLDGNSEPQFVNVNPIKIIVRTIEINAQGDIQDVKAPLKIQLDWLMILLIILIVVVVIVGVYFLYRYYRKKKLGIVPQKKIIKLPPYRIALDSLSELETKKLWQQGMIKEYHSEITGIIRKYFEDKFNFRALEMTSSEVLLSLKNINDTREIVEITDEFLNNADLVKFAKFKPIPTINEDMMKQAYEIVNKTKVEDEVKVETLEVKNV